MTRGVFGRSSFLLAALAAPAFFSGTLLAQAPTVLTVPAVPGSPSSHHSSWSGSSVTLKGSIGNPVSGHSYTYDWDPGDGGGHCSGSVSDTFTIECAHTYSGSVGSLFIGVLNVTDTTAGVSAASGGNCPPSITTGTCYYTELFNAPPNLPAEVNAAIDNGLWFLHKNMRRYTQNSQDFGDWYKCDANQADACQVGVLTATTAMNCVAFENSSFLQTTVPANPYTDDVRRCLNSTFNELQTMAIPNNVTNPYGTFNPDTNSNTYALTTVEGNQPYQLGSVIDAIVASGTQNTPVPSGTTLRNDLTNHGVGTYTYHDAVIDLVDYYAYCQNITANDPTWGFQGGGGWRYSCRDASDNSTNQWAAIGLIPARREFGATIPSLVLRNNENSLSGTYHANSANNGYFGYTDSSPIWGPYADTPSGMVQLAMQGLGRGKQLTTGESTWEGAETFMRDNFGNTGDATQAPKSYLYGLLSFTKAMLLHSNDGTGATASTLSNLHSTDQSIPDIDWWAAQTPAFGGSDPTDGVARWLVSIQNSNGSWWGHNYSSTQFYLETSMAITMLRRTVFKPVPTACATSRPQPIANGGPIALDGTCSTPGNFPLATWKWDISGTAGTNFNPAGLTCLVQSCAKATFRVNAPAGWDFSTQGSYSFPVRLRITDTDSPAVSSELTFNVIIGAPPNPPTANAGGPYNFCPAKNLGGAFIYAPFLLDGSHSTNPDQGTTDGTPAAPPSTITAYDWDFACANAWNSQHSSQPDVTTAFTQPSVIGTTFNVCLRVTNNDNLAFPSAVLPAGLTSTASAQVTVNSTSDPNCTHCVSTLSALVKQPAPGVPGNIQLYWFDTNSVAFPIDHYNVYRSTVANFSTFVQLAGAASSPHIAGIPAPAALGSKLAFVDTSVAPGTTYFYRIAPATVSDTETCASPPTIQVSVGACPRCR